MTNESWRDTYDAWKTRECEPDEYGAGCRYCAEIDRQLAQQVEINEALRDVLVDVTRTLKASIGSWAVLATEESLANDLREKAHKQWEQARAALTEAETILGGES